MNADLAPSWHWLDHALINGMGSFVRMLGYLDEIAELGFKEQLQNGPNEGYIRALKSLPYGEPAPT